MYIWDSQKEVNSFRVFSKTTDSIGYVTLWEKLLMENYVDWSHLICSVKIILEILKNKTIYKIKDA